MALHHRTEEKFLFSALEEQIPSARGILATNVHQHKEFHDGLAAFETFVNSALAGREPYDPEGLLKLIDSFSEPLMKHFEDEILTLMRLEETGQGKIVMKVHEEFEVIVRKNVDAVHIPFLYFQLVYKMFSKLANTSSKAKVAPMTLLNADKTYEDGKHAFPVMPKFVPYLIKYLVSRKYAGAWKFGSCDYWGQPVTLFMNTQEGRNALAVGRI